MLSGNRYHGGRIKSIIAVSTCFYNEFDLDLELPFKGGKEIEMKATGLLRGDAGFSLLEAVMAIAIIAVISGIAVTAAVQHLEDARLSRAAADTQMIGISIHSFMNDTGWPPVFKNGKARSPEDTFLVLETGGSDPVISSSLHRPAIASNADDVELLENQLVKNQPGATPGANPD